MPSELVALLRGLEADLLSLEQLVLLCLEAGLEKFSLDNLDFCLFSEVSKCRPHRPPSSTDSRDFLAAELSLGSETREAAGGILSHGAIVSSD